METQVRTLQAVFTQAQQLVVPLFQRPYIWNQDDQWDPLWKDVVRVAENLLKRSQDRTEPHFLGAVVLQQAHKQTGLMQERTIIDGQQRLTTLQLLLDALRLELLAANAVASAQRIELLVANAEPFCARAQDRFKVWPTNRDRSAFSAAMGGSLPGGQGLAAKDNDRILQAHHFFREQARQWLALGADILIRAQVIERAVREFLHMVVIDLSADENAQQIFETLNARGAQLAAADLIKNFVFQRLLESETDVQEEYDKKWKEFETGFWETSISVGRFRYPRSSIFLNHWLVARTGEEIVTSHVFSRFKTFAEFDAKLTMSDLLEQIRIAATIYRQFVESAASEAGPLDRLGLFSYRTSVLESEVIKPLVLCLRDPQETPVPEDQLIKALDAVESWMVRRMIVRATTKAYNHVISELVSRVRQSDRTKAGDLIEEYLGQQSSDSQYWPDDQEIQRELAHSMAYRRLRSGRLRMILEAIEDEQRGWKNGKPALGGERVVRGNFIIEHVMPQMWITHWPVREGGEQERERLVQTIGNLTLLTGRLNTKVSNGPWLGPKGKREGLEGHDVLLLNRELLKKAGDHWTEGAIQERTTALTAAILRIWPVPLNHKSGFSAQRTSPPRKVRLADLINAGALQPGMTLFPRRKDFADQVATLLPDGQLEMKGVLFSSPSDAAKRIVGSAMNGWWFFLVEKAARRSLSDVRRDYLNAMAMDSDEDDGEAEGDAS